MFLIYHVETTKIVRHPVSRRELYETLAAARAALTRMGLSRGPYEISEATRFHKFIEKQEVRKNLMSGKEFTQGVNTPLCCDPSSETYWSM